MTRNFRIGTAFPAAIDSKGNVYTTETYRGQRVQEFVYKGMAPVTKQDQDVVWPKLFPLELEGRIPPRPVPGIFVCPA